MDKGRYDYDSDKKQYRRKYPREVIEKPDPESVSRDIYSTGHGGEEPLHDAKRPSYSPPGKKWKVLFWVFFVAACAFWIYLIYLAVGPGEDDIEPPSLHLNSGLITPLQP